MIDNLGTFAVFFIPLLTPFVLALYAHALTGHDECRETLRAWVAEKLRACGWPYDNLSWSEAVKLRSSSDPDENIKADVDEALDPRNSTVSDWDEIYSNMQHLFGVTTASAKLRKAVDDYLKKQEEVFSEWSANHPGASRTEIARKLLQLRKVHPIEWIRFAGIRNLFKEIGPAILSTLGRYLDYVGRGTAFGLLVGLALDAAIGGHVWSTRLPITFGIIGSFLHALSIALATASSESKKTRGAFFFTLLVIYGFSLYIFIPKIL